MNFTLARTLFCATALCFGAPLLAASVDYADKQSENDMAALRRFLNDKRLITVKELGGDLSLSGEVRAEFQDTNETLNGIRQRGSYTKLPAQAWDIELNILLDYRTERTWAAIKLEFDNDMGTDGGTVNKIRVEKAYLGGRIVPGDTFTMDAEIGRRYFSSVFDSKVEFGAFFDGALFRFNKAFVEIGDYYFNTGGFLINDKSNQYGYIGEMGMLRIGNVGLNAKYSVVDWRKHFSNDQKNERFRYVVQQFLLSYQFNPAWLNKKLIKFYGAGMTNLIAGDLVLGTQLATTPEGKIVQAGDITNFGPQNWGWYAGVAIGQAKKMGDWAIEVNYQWIQAQTVPDFDFMGIGRGNAAKAGLYTVNIDGTGQPTTKLNATGPCNYQGFEIDVLYAFTDNLVVEENFKWSNTLNTNIGPDLKFRQFEVEFIYAF